MVTGITAGPAGSRVANVHKHTLTHPDCPGVADAAGSELGGRGLTTIQHIQQALLFPGSSSKRDVIYVLYIALFTELTFTAHKVTQLCAWSHLNS